MSRPAWQIQQQRTQQQRQLAQSFRNHQEGIAHTRYQQKQSGYNGKSGLGFAAVGAGIGGAAGGPVGAAIGGAVGWVIGKLR